MNEVGEAQVCQFCEIYKPLYEREDKLARDGASPTSIHISRERPGQSRGQALVGP